jgi:hypothetical protein
MGWGSAAAGHGFIHLIYSMSDPYAAVRFDLEIATDIARIF